MDPLQIWEWAEGLFALAEDRKKRKKGMRRKMPEMRTADYLFWSAVGVAMATGVLMIYFTWRGVL